METYHYNNLLSKSLFLDSQNDSNADSTSDEEIDVGEEDLVPIDGEFAVESEEEDDDTEDDDEDEEDSTDYNKFMRKRIVPMIPSRSRYNKKPAKPVKKKRNHNTMERVRREKVTMCYDVLRGAIGQDDSVSRNRTLEVAADFINKFSNRLKDVNDKIEDYEQKIQLMMRQEAGMASVQNNRIRFARR